MGVVEDRLWGFILQQVWISIVVYVAIVVIAAARDIVHKQLTKHRPDRTFRFLSRSLWQRAIAKSYNDSASFFFIEWTRLLSNLLVCVIYVYTTYIRRVPLSITIVNCVLAGLFTFDIVFGALLASSAMLYFMQFARLLQIFAIPSLFMAEGPSAYLHFGFLRAFSAYDAYIRLERRAGNLQFAPKKFAFRLFFQCLTLFYALAAGIQMLEIPGDWRNQAWLESFGNEWTFFNSIYWVIVTLSTVGFGDMSPSTIQGRIYTIFMIIIGIIVFSNIVQNLFKEMKRQRGNGSYRENYDTRHVIVSGTPNLADLVHFVKEFYNRQPNQVAQIVVLVEEPKWSDNDWYKYIVRNAFLQQNVHYFVGSLISTDDLQRAGINSADAVFILTSPASNGEASAQDTQVVMSALAIRNARTDIPIYSQTLLEDSNMQIGVAMKTPAAFSFQRPNLQRKLMAPNAQYCGIYESVRRLESDSLPLSLRSSTEEHSSSADVSNTPERSEGKDNARGANQQLEYQTDLDRSSNICLQQMYSSLLVANIKANGVGTLLTNLYLELPVIQVGLPWLAEYHLGACCSLSHAIIPATLDGAVVKDVTALLFRRGVVIVATQGKDDLTISTVLSTTQKLKAGELGLFISFLAAEHLTIAVHIVGLEYKRGESATLCSNFKQQREKSEDELTPSQTRAKAKRRSSLTSGLEAVNTEPATIAIAAPSAGGQGDSGDRLASTISPRDQRRLGDNGLRPSPLSGRPRRPPVAPSPRELMLGESRGMLGSRSLDQMTLVPSTSADYMAPDTLDYAAFESSGNIAALKKSRSSFDIPKELKNHVIVAMEGKTPLANLPFFLRLFWHKSRPSQELRSKVPVVVIHPEIPSEVRESFENDERYSRLFFVNESPALRFAWERAKLSDAKAVATMADYTQQWRVSDARTIYTLLTLDALTTSQQNLFICSELIDEHSLEFLREPFHPRRRGARLGNPLIQHTASEPIPSAPDPVGWSENDEDQTAEDLTATAIASARVPPTQVQEAAVYSGDHWGSSISGSSASDVSQEEVLATNALFGGDAHMDTSSSMLSRPAREFLFSRVRYISGELLVHSTADTLLVREYAEPGFARFLRSLCGADPTDAGQKIRLVRIPRDVFKEYHEIEGKRLVEYGVIFERLVSLGVTPLGLYRSGDAPVRIPKLKRMMRGEGLLREAALIDVSSTAAKAARGNGVGPIQKIVRQGQQVLPMHVKSERGQKQLLGVHGGDSRPLPPDSNATEYRQEAVEGNPLPYVYTLPDANTLVAETDGVYVLCDPAFELPRIWPRPAPKVADLLEQLTT